jgi:hypothetical protein
MTELETPQRLPTSSYGRIIIEGTNEADTPRDKDDHRSPEADCEPKHPDVPPSSIDNLPL